MRHARLTWPGAFHHVMNRGHNGEKIFLSNTYKEEYLKILGDEAIKKKIRMFGYCIMDNHFHIILQNSSGHLSEFMKIVNTRYGIYYRVAEGGRGYVFHDRFKSTVIQDESYLLAAIPYFLNNPVRARLVTSPFDYKWSSAPLYFKKANHPFLDLNFVESLYSSKNNFLNSLKEALKKDFYKEERTKFGFVFGDKKFCKKAEKMFDRRKEPSKYFNKREEDFYFDPVEKIIQEFEKELNLSIDDIDTSSHMGKRFRGEFLRRLKDLGGLKYTEIYEFDIFKNLRFGSLGRLYQRARLRLGQK